MIKSICYIVLTSLVSLNQRSCAQGSDAPSHLISYAVGPCKEQYDLYKEKILSSEFRYKDDTLIVNIQFNAACCLTLEISEKELIGDELRLNLNRMGNPCDCYCIYPIELKMNSLPGDNLKLILLEKHQIKIE